MNEGDDPPARAAAGSSLPDGDRKSEAPSTLQTAMAGARPTDSVGAVVARWRVAAALFGPNDKRGVGRFRLGDRLGAGGMGVIYAAYDPELERAVAVKLVQLAGPDGTAAALAEAKALARLSHPNVVTIFDYGIAEGQLYIVMELVQGQTLAQWVKGRPSRDIVKAYRQAGEALAAAHAVALVHRDFKPQNAIMGHDGRVRVVDFGLACEVVDPEKPDQTVPRPAGTPGYMAPEQVRGGAVTAAADQFGFCTALRQALGAQKRRARASATERHVEAVLERGRAADPRDRFPSMRALLDALSRDPSAMRRRWAAAIALAGAGVAAFTSGRVSTNARANVCDGGLARLATVWSEDDRAAALRRLALLSPYGRSLRPRLQNELNEHTRRWTAGYRDVCLARERGIQSAALTDRRMACLESGRAALKAVGEIVRTTDIHDLSNVVLAVRALPDPEGCNDLTALLSDGEAPTPGEAPQVSALRARLEEARVQIAAGRPTQARPIAEEAVTAARTLAYRPLLPEALLVEGHAMMNSDDRVAAIEVLTESLTGGLKVGLDSIAVEAWARRAWAHGTSLGGEEALSGLEIIQAMADNRGTSQFSRALLHNNVGCVELALERRDRARTAFAQAARAASGVVGPGATELLNVADNLGLVTDDPVRRDDILANAAAAKARALGDEHPETLATRLVRGAMSVQFQRALELLAPTCAGLDVSGGVRAIQCWLDVGYIRGELDERAGAVAALRRAAAAPAPAVPLAAPYIALWEGHAEAASHLFTGALNALPANPREPWWDRFQRAELELGLGRALRASGHLGAARTALRTSLARFVELARKDPSPRVAHRLARARAELAKLSVALPAPTGASADLARLAAGWLRQAGGVPSELVELETIAAGREHHGHEIERVSQ
jgi:hypothetical protein